MNRLRSWKLLVPFALAAVGVLALALALSRPAAAAPSRQGTYPADTITVSGVGEATGAPDVANLEMGVEIVGQDIGEGLSQVNGIIDAVVEALTGLGVAQEDIQTSGLSVWPEDRMDPQTGMPTGERNYRVRNTVRVNVRDLEQVGAVIDAGISAGANTMYGISFNIENPADLQSQARADAFEDARARAAQLAELAGVTLGDPITVNEVYGTGFSPVAAYGMGGGGGGVQQGQLSVSVQVEVTFSITR